MQLSYTITDLVIFLIPNENYEISHFNDCYYSIINLVLIKNEFDNVKIITIFTY